MNATELIDSLVARGLARSVRNREGTSRSVVASGVELAIAAQAQERKLRARWRERVGSTGTPYLLIADLADVEGAILALGPSSADGPVRQLNADALFVVIERAAQLNSLEAVRYVAGEIDRLRHRPRRRTVATPAMRRSWW